MRSTVCNINDALARIFAGGKFYGVVDLITREGVTQPTEGHYDDANKITGYHRIIDANVTGRGFNNIITWNMVLILNNNTGLYSTDILTAALSAFNGVNVARIILNSQQIHDVEYRGSAYTGANLIQINYRIETAARKDCCALPEGNCFTTKK